MRQVDQQFQYAIEIHKQKAHQIRTFWEALHQEFLASELRKPSSSQELLHWWTLCNADLVQWMKTNDR